MILLRWIGFAILLAALGGCGFRLAGKAELDPMFDKTHVTYKSGGKEVAEQLEIQLKANDIDLVQPDEASTTVAILYEYHEKNILSLDTNGNPREYELILEVGFDVSDQSGKKLIAKQDIHLSRDLLFRVNDVLGKNEEERELYDEMRADVARLIIYRLQAIGQ